MVSQTEATSSAERGSKKMIALCAVIGFLSVLGGLNKGPDRWRVELDPEEGTLYLVAHDWFGWHEVERHELRFIKPGWRWEKRPGQWEHLPAGALDKINHVPLDTDY